MKIKKSEIFVIRLPFKLNFRHRLASRSSNYNIILKLTSEEGIPGYGESIPRLYLTGETINSTLKILNKEFIPKILNKKFSSFNDVKKYLTRLKTDYPSAKCALELALLDCAGKTFKKQILKPNKDKIKYGAIISASGKTKTIITALKIKALGIKSIKLKIGFDDDIQRLKILRQILGKNIEIGVDANCAWGCNAAIEKIKEMKKFNICFVEQPLAKNDVRGFAKLKANTEVPIIIDESLSSMKDAKIFKDKCDIFNIRISKCGGILNCLELVKFARKNKIKCKLGCLVGESGILTAAGRIFASNVEDLKYIEGSYNSYLLKEDIIKEDLTFGYAGIARAIDGYGLGITVDDKKIKKYCVKKC